LPAEGAYSAPPDPLAGFKGAASQQEGQRKEGREGTNVGREEGSSPLPPIPGSAVAHGHIPYVIFKTKSWGLC